jgi:hypothetical protein
MNPNNVKLPLKLKSEAWKKWVSNNQDVLQRVPITQFIRNDPEILDPEVAQLRVEYYEKSIPKSIAEKGGKTQKKDMYNSHINNIRTHLQNEKTLAGENNL